MLPSTESTVCSAVGSAVSLSVGEEVAGILPLDSECPGCAEYCVLPEYCLVVKPATVSHADCAASLRGGLMAYTILYHQTRLEPGAIILLCSAMEGERMIILQLCDVLGAKVHDRLSVMCMEIIKRSLTRYVVKNDIEEGTFCVTELLIFSPGYDLKGLLFEAKGYSYTSNVYV